MRSCTWPASSRWKRAGRTSIRPISAEHITRSKPRAGRESDGLSSRHRITRSECKKFRTFRRSTSRSSDSWSAPSRPFGPTRCTAFGKPSARRWDGITARRTRCRLRASGSGSITEHNDPRHPGVAQSSGWLNLTDEQKFKRYAATWMSQHDFARLVRAILTSDVPFGVVYGVGDNATRFWDLEPGRALYGFWPEDGIK